MASEIDKPPNIVTTVEDLLLHLMVEGEVTAAAVRITMNSRTWVVTQPVIHQHRLVNGVDRTRDFEVKMEVFQAALEKGFLEGKRKGPIVSCTERVISHKGIAHFMRSRAAMPAK